MCVFFSSLICEKRQLSEVFTTTSFIKSQFKHLVRCLRAISTSSSVNSPYLLSILLIVDPFLLSLYKFFLYKNLGVGYKLQIFSHRPFLFHLSFGFSFSLQRCSWFCHHSSYDCSFRPASHELLHIKNQHTYPDCELFKRGTHVVLIFVFQHETQWLTHARCLIC